MVGANWMCGSIRIMQKKVQLLQQQQQHRFATNHLLVAEANTKHSYSKVISRSDSPPGSARSQPYITSKEEVIPPTSAAEGAMPSAERAIPVLRTVEESHDRVHLGDDGRKEMVEPMPTGKLYGIAAVVTKEHMLHDSTAVLSEPKCRVCQEQFPTRNQLFEHLRTKCLKSDLDLRVGRDDAAHRLRWERRSKIKNNAGKQDARASTSPAQPTIRGD